MPTFSFDAQVTAALFDKTGAIFALGDGSVRFENGARSEVHDGAVLCAVVHPSGEGVVTGGDDGKVVWSREGEAVLLATSKGQWIDSIDASAESGLIAFSAGRTLSVIDSKDVAFRRDFQHERTVSGVAFDPKGRRIAASTYGGAWLWYAKIAEQKPYMLKWAGSHVGLAFSPDGKFLMSAMQENALHGWRVADDKNLRMGGYPVKVKSLAFVAKGQLLITSGANGLVAWPFAGSTGPMGKQAAEVGFDESAMVVRVDGMPGGQWVCAGLDDGRVWACDLAGQRIIPLKAEKGAEITALAMSKDGTRVAWGDEDGAVGIASV